MLRLQGYQLYEVNLGCPDVYARWKHQASQWDETHVCLGGGKWVTQEWRIEQLFASSTRAQAYVIDAQRHCIWLGCASNSLNENVTAILRILVPLNESFFKARMANVRRLQFLRSNSGFYNVTNARSRLPSFTMWQMADWDILHWKNQLLEAHSQLWQHGKDGLTAYRFA